MFTYLTLTGTQLLTLKGTPSVDTDRLVDTKIHTNCLHRQACSLTLKGTLTVDTDRLVDTKMPY